MFGWVTEVAALTGAVVALVALVVRTRRDRSEIEKLKLEIRQLGRSPEVIADRRAVYDRLREVVRGMTDGADASDDHIRLLHEIHHDSALCFPNEIAEGVRELIRNAVALHVTNKNQGWARDRLDQSSWKTLCEKNDAALRSVVEYEEHMLDTFKAHLSR